jgi:RNA polymerase sigma factor (sigma-70 family)
VDATARYRERVTDRELTAALREFAARDYGLVVSSVARATGDPHGAADAVHEAILQLLETAPRHPIINLAAWITVVATNRGHDGRRRSNAEQRAVARIALALEHYTLTEPLDVDVRAALQSLPMQQRRICVLFYLVDESVEAIAEQLGLTTGTVKTQLFRARRALGDRLAVRAAA